jgi:hypothetical protein
MNYRHDFGLLSEEEKEKVRTEAKEWLLAWKKADRNYDRKFIWTGQDGKEQISYNEARCVIDLLFWNYLCLVSRPGYEGVEKETVAIEVNTSDTFAWGYSNTDPFPNREIENLWEMVQKEGFFGLVRWTCRRDNKQPQQAIIDDMKKAGFWDEEMENLGHNEFNDYWNGLEKEEEKEEGEDTECSK